MVNSLTSADVAVTPSRLDPCPFIDEKTKTVVARRLNSSNRFSARMRPDEIPLQQFPCWFLLGPVPEPGDRRQGGAPKIMPASPVRRLSFVTSFLKRGAAARETLATPVDANTC